MMYWAARGPAPQASQLLDETERTGLLGAGGPDQVDRVVDHVIGWPGSRARAAGSRAGRGPTGSAGSLHWQAWVVALTIRRSSSRAGIADVDREHEPVELGFGQRIGSFLLDRVLGGHDEERRLEVERVGPGRDLVLLHGLQECGLGLGRRAVDLVGQHDVGEDRPLHEAETRVCRWPGPPR